MTTQEKTTAINNVLANYQDNVAATNAATISAGSEAIVVQARNTALVNDLALIFSTKQSELPRGKKPKTDR